MDSSFDKRLRKALGLPAKRSPRVRTPIKRLRFDDEPGTILVQSAPLMKRKAAQEEPEREVTELEAPVGSNHPDFK